MAGRPRYEPTPADRATVKSLAAAGVPQDRIAVCIGSYGVDLKTLRKYFRRELDAARTEVTAFAMSKLLDAVKKGEAWAICFWMKCRENWSELHRVTGTGPGGSIDLSVTSHVELFRSRIARIAQRRREGGSPQGTN